MATTSNHIPSPIKRDSADTVYQQVAQQLIEEIKQLNPGDRFSTEEDIIDRYEVSRTTVRRAVQLIVDRGLVVRRQGKGHS